MSSAQTPPGWRLSLVGDIFHIQLGKMLAGNAKSGRDMRPYLANRNVQWGEVNLDRLGEMNFTPMERNMYSLRVGDILVCEGGEVGRTAIWTQESFECYFQNAIHRLRPRDSREVFPRYFLYFMEFANSWGLFGRLSSKTSIAHLSKEKLAFLEVPLPPLWEQKKIAEVLGAVDESIDSVKRGLSGLKLLRLGQLSAQIGQFSATDVLGSYVVDGPKNGIYKHRSLYGSVGTPILRIDSFGDGVISSPSQLRRVSLGEGERGSYELCENDIVINRVNSIDYIGKSALVRGLRELTVFESNVMRVRIDQSTLNPMYASLVLSGEACLRYFQSRAKSAISQASINKKDVVSCPLPVPPLEEQFRIVSIIETHDERIAAERARLEKLRKLKAGLMDDLLTGRVRVDQLKDLPV